MVNDEIIKPNSSTDVRPVRHCYVVTGGEIPEGASSDIFGDLGKATEAIKAGLGSDSDVTNVTTGPEEIVITFGDAPEGTSAAPKSKNRLQFYFDSYQMGSDGDGSDTNPWPSIAHSFDEILRLEKEGKLQPKSGQSLFLTRREPFTSTGQERRKKRSESIAKYVFMGMAAILVLPVFAILGFLVREAWPALSWDFITQNPTNGMTAGGIWAPLVGTFFLVLVSLLIAAPIGVLAGVYLNEYAKDNWLTRTINLAVVNLAGVPSIVHALFGVGAFVAFAGFGESLLAASCTLAVMTLPVIITSTREALASVPMSFREACWNMGASRWQTIRTIVLPNSISGILTGVILQVSRAAGETAPILFTGAAYFMDVPDEGIGYWLPYGLGDKVMALSYHLFALKTQVNNAPDHLAYGTAVVLIGLVLLVNSVSIGIRTYMRTRKKW